MDIKVGAEAIFKAIQIMAPGIGHEITLRIVLFTKEDYEAFMDIAQSMDLPLSCLGGFLEKKGFFFW